MLLTAIVLFLYGKAMGLDPNLVIIGHAVLLLAAIANVWLVCSRV